MIHLANKKIILGITGSIAAYKSCHIVRELIKAGCEVKVIMTPDACEFVTPLTLSTLSKNEVIVDIVDDEAWNNHVELGLWADLFLIAPVTANTLAKMAQGQVDNMLLATYLSAKCPVLYAPAMDLDMWKHPSTKKNLKTLEGYGHKMIPVGHGELASGLVGDGRMAEPEDIRDFLNDYLASTQDLSGKKILITAGPTYEAIDPVRYIGNRSSGLMGICLAEEAASRGASVTIVLGPTHLRPAYDSIECIHVTSADEMYKATSEKYAVTDISIFAAAVADYRPKSSSDKKIKKADSNVLEIQLVENIDIAKSLGEKKQPGQINIGFALETNNEIENASKKIGKKNFDFVVLNSLKDKGAGFQHATNKVTILHKDNTKVEFELKSKKDVAKDILDELVNKLM